MGCAWTFPGTEQYHSSVRFVFGGLIGASINTCLLVSQTPRGSTHVGRDELFWTLGGLFKFLLGDGECAGVRNGATSPKYMLLVPSNSALLSLEYSWKIHKISMLAQFSYISDRREDIFSLGSLPLSPCLTYHWWRLSTCTFLGS